MRTSRLLWLAVPVASSSLLLLHCVGDPPANPTVDAGNDVVSSSDAGSDVSLDAGKPDAPPPCVLPDSGTSGSLDVTFTNAETTFTNAFDPTDITIDGQGQVYVTGAATNCVSSSSGLDMAIVRLTAGGVVDTAFNPANKPRCVHFDSVDKAYGVGVDPDGNIVIAGLAGQPNKFYAGVARLKPNGTLDTTFNGTGLVDVLGIDAGVPAATGAGMIVAFDVAFDPATKKIWVVGGDDNGGGVGPTKGYVARLNTNGTVDLGFAGGVLDDATVDGFWSAVDDGAGGVYVVGQSHSPKRMVVKHFDVTGKNDTAFGDGGTTVPTADASAGDRGRSLLRLADGKLVVAGAAYATGSTPPYGTGPVAVARLTSTGAPDPAFGGGALNASTKVNLDTFYMAHILGQLCDGTVLLAGRQDVVPNTNQDLALVKLNAFGSVDLSFGTAGVASLPVAGNQIPIGAAQDPKSGKVVVIGRTTITGTIIGARFNP